ncbi:MAG: All-trans-phytoene synthase [Gemmatimonadaceae bacterium]|nr:All-trans-phytoene synthase [Gemmatimonadaceae bacterium]
MSDARICAEIVKGHGRTFALASRLLPREKRRGSCALYAMCRLADDIVDRARPGTPASLVRQELDAFEAGIRRAVSGFASTPVEREVSWAVQRFEIPPATIEELLAGIASDIEPPKYATWDQVQRYCAAVASSVGEMCVAVFGVSAASEARTDAIRHARQLGAAMQLTNIVRDVGEDLERGRCYLPEEDLRQQGFSAEDVLTRRVLRKPAQWQSVMELQIERARALYRAAAPGIALLAPDAQACALACATGYSAILDVVERNGYDNITQRAQVAWGSRARILFAAWRGKDGDVRPHNANSAVA